MENEWQLGRWWRVPLAMHWTVLLMLPWMFLWYRDVAITVGAFTGYFLVLLAHEFGHVWMARRLRIPVEGILLVGIHGQTSHGYANRADDLKIAWSGVGSQLLILLAAWLTTPLVLRLQLPLLDRFVGGLWLGFTDINLFLVVAALLPIGPFDGHRAWQVIPYWRDRFRRRRRGR
ncbi:MAG TPA: hypothetical protein VHE37_01000, partial [Nevskiaceae bacterium]|nr:hypothetical protein [Nevskiaceae bacterium]